MGCVAKKQKMNCIVFLLCCLLSVSCTKRHYLLMTEDYGILNREDLDFESEFAPLNQTANFRPPYFHAWQCFPLKHYEIYCDARGFDVPQEKLDKYEPVGQVVLKIHHDSEIFEFSTKRPYDYKYCFELESEWNAIFEGQPYGCVAGQHLESESLTANKDVISHSHWEIRQLKSLTGYWTYFSRKQLDTTGK